MGSHYSPLTFEERRKIDQWHDAKVPVLEIADRLGRASSTISRELQRNAYEDTEIPELDGYSSMTAQNAYERRRAIHRKLISNPELKAVVEDRL
ncbi:Helix-turn-helix domain-containing protein [Paracoccus seriniphilus]|uniref:Helix-turn-helix domain-containing protein n=1 Tax=Paracoccus seriniphilus TaxID=184748 RepID=A0A239PMI0_9RHOB|nr:Helix-turn-helix domain-containing protein [Paracoccus seriniphilus]